MSIFIDFPDGHDTSGNGNFFAWGTHSAPFTAVTRAHLEWATGSTDRPVSMPGPGSCTWYVLFTSAPTNTNLTLTIYGQQMNTPGEVAGDSVTFKCLGHHTLFRKGAGKPAQEKPPSER